ncbi:MAG TPA: 6-carboxytetrahydropterin synthase [Candidatus Polarisedimenticolia bacterium]|nr:6-carboxytetrahydropterin synthase [Candidatus Polarisedimenticolia bacterium]
MYTVTEILDFCYGHRLLRYQGKCAHLHGHNGRVEIVVAAKTLDRQSMVTDFSEIQRVVRGFIDEHLDHKLLLAKDDPLVDVLKKQDEPIFVMDSDPTAEAIARLICDKARAAGLDVAEVRLWETPASVASYVPSR